jgi:hypothetical protein
MILVVEPFKYMALISNPSTPPKKGGVEIEMAFKYTDAQYQSK